MQWAAEVGSRQKDSPHSARPCRSPLQASSIDPPPNRWLVEILPRPVRRLRQGRPCCSPFWLRSTVVAPLNSSHFVLPADVADPCRSSRANSSDDASAEIAHGQRIACSRSAPRGRAGGVGRVVTMQPIALPLSAENLRILSHTVAPEIATPRALPGKGVRRWRVLPIADSVLDSICPTPPIPVTCGTSTLTGTAQSPERGVQRVVHVGRGEIQRLCLY